MQADLILYNGNIHTMDTAKPRGQAIAIAGDRVVAVGGNDEIRALRAPTTKAVDLQGRTVVPGFTDAHLHFLSYGIGLREIDLAGVPTLEEALARVAARAAARRQPASGSRAAAGITPCGATAACRPATSRPAKTWIASRPIIRSSCGASAVTPAGPTRAHWSWLASPRRRPIRSAARLTMIRSPASPPAS